MYSEHIALLFLILYFKVVSLFNMFKHICLNFLPLVFDKRLRKKSCPETNASTRPANLNCVAF